MIEDHYTEDDDESFEDFFRWYLAKQTDIVNGDFRLVLPDQIITGLGYAEARDAAVQAIKDAGYGVWDYEQTDWDVEYFVEQGDDWVVFATVESEAE